MKEQNSQDDEIDLMQIILTLAAHKYRIFGVTALVVSTAILYCYKATPIYKTTLMISPPTKGDVQPLNAFWDSFISVKKNIKADPLSPADAFHRLQLNLLSHSLHKKVFDENLSTLTENKQLSKEEKLLLFERFQKSISLPKQKQKAEKDAPLSAIKLSIENPFKEKAASILNSLFLLAENKTKKELLIEPQSTHQREILNTEKEIESIKAKEKKEHQDKMVRLKDASLVARKLNIKFPVDLYQKKTKEQTPSRDLTVALNMESHQNQERLYARGYQVLEAELAALSLRKDLDPFTRRLREQERKLHALKSFNIKASNLRVATKDGYPATAVSPIKPKKPLILLLSLILGIFLGVCLVLFESSIEKKKAKIEEEKDLEKNRNGRNQEPIHTA